MRKCTVNHDLFYFAPTLTRSWTFPCTCILATRWNDVDGNQRVTEINVRFPISIRYLHLPFIRDPLKRRGTVCSSCSTWVLPYILNNKKLSFLLQNVSKQRRCKLHWTNWEQKSRLMSMIYPLCKQETERKRERRRETPVKHRYKHNIAKRLIV